MEGLSNSSIENKYRQLEEEISRVQSGQSYELIKEQIGQNLYAFVQNSSNNSVDKELEIKAFLEHVFKAVEGFSDYRAEYFGLASFIALSIEGMGFEVGLVAAKAGSILYSTHEVDSNYDRAWASAIIKKCTAFYSDINLMSSSFERDIIQSCQMLDIVDASGDEYVDLLLNEGAELKSKLLSALNSVSSELCTLTAKKKKAIIKKLSKAKSLFLNGEEKLSSLVESVDINCIDFKNVDKVFFAATNLMCEDSPRDELLAISAANSPLAAVAVKVLMEVNEETHDTALLGAGVFISELLRHATKAEVTSVNEIAVKLKELGAFEGIMKQFTFWAEDWGGMYGDGATPMFECLHDFIIVFPDLIDVVKNKPKIVTLVKQRAESHKAQTQQYHNFHFQEQKRSAGSCAVATALILEPETADSASVSTSGGPPAFSFTF